MKFSLEDVIVVLGSFDPNRRNVESSGGGCSYRHDNDGTMFAEDLPAPTSATKAGCIVGEVVFQLNRQLFIEKLAASGSSVTRDMTSDADEILAEIVTPSAHKFLACVQANADQHEPWGDAIQHGFRDYMQYTI